VYYFVEIPEESYYIVLFKKDWLIYPSPLFIFDFT